MNKKGLTFVNTAKFKKAVEFYNKAMILITTNIGKIKGDCLSKLDKFISALCCYEKAIEINPNCNENWINQGNCYLNLGQYECALKCYDKAIDIGNI